jgi:hypothetical protein
MFQRNILQVAFYSPRFKPWAIKGRESLNGFSRFLNLMTLRVGTKKQSFKDILFFCLNAGAGFQSSFISLYL